METKYLPEGQLLTTPANREATSSLTMLERAQASGSILEATVLLCDAEQNLHVDFPSMPGIRGIIPREETVYTNPGEPIKDIAILTRVGKAVCFKVQGFDEPDADGRITVRLSRRAAQAECAAVFLADLASGDIVRGRVTHLESFGAFVDIGCGLCSLLPVDAMSVSRIRHPRERLYNGQLIWTVVRSADPITGRIFLTMRELLGTWSENAAHFEPGQTVAGIVRSVENYGVFVELTPNLAGLAELRDGDQETAQTLIGRTAAVFIKSITPERMKIKLVLIDTYRNEPVPAPRLEYFIRGDRVSHIGRWTYSPPGAKRLMETVFSYQ